MGKVIRMLEEIQIPYKGGFNMDKPEYLEEEHLLFLDDLRESGITNMFGAGRYLTNEFPSLTSKEGSKILSYWMKTFSKKTRKYDVLSDPEFQADCERDQITHDN